MYEGDIHFNGNITLCAMYKFSYTLTKLYTLSQYTDVCIR